MTSRHSIQSVLTSTDKNQVRIAATDIDGVFRGKYIHKEKLLDSPDNPLGFCDVIFGWDTGDVLYDQRVRATGWHTGYPDAVLTPDPESFRLIPWENQTPFMLGDFSNDQGPIAEICPRTLLTRLNREAEAMGCTPLFAQEYEWYNFRESSQSLEEKGYKNPQPITPGMFGYSLIRAAESQPFMDRLFEQLEAFDIPLEGIHTETGPGVYEAAIRHTKLVEAGDRAVLFKSAVKELARKEGYTASFMAKWHEQYPGSGAHIHQSLWDASMENNLFFSKDDTHRISELMRHYLAGILHTLPHFTALYAPTVNSYKRLRKGAWAPVSCNWGFDNRTTAIRVLRGSMKGTRLEMRVPGADCHPYLAMAACLAGGIYGIRNKLQLEDSPVKGNGYDDLKSIKLPGNLWEAAQLLGQSKIARELFGDTFIDHFVATRYWEVEQYGRSVTDWERQRYFEII